jgi:hypothetical protein
MGERPTASNRVDDDEEDEEGAALAPPPCEDKEERMVCDGKKLEAYSNENEKTRTIKRGK